jgi:hypothetical protein
MNRATPGKQQTRIRSATVGHAPPSFAAQTCPVPVLLIGWHIGGRIFFLLYLH